MSQLLNECHEALIRHALSLPGTREDRPWGERVAKVGDKVFVFFGKSNPAAPRLLVCVKLPESGLSALDLPYCQPANYGMGKHGWVMASFEPGDRPPLELLRTWVLESYRAIAPKKLVAALDGAPQPAAAKPARKRKASKVQKSQVVRRRQAKSPIKKKPGGSKGR
jgi:predicted DNA-binding protein (MmcQ/YjbR family)